MAQLTFEYLNIYLRYVLWLCMLLSEFESEAWLRADAAGVPASDSDVAVLAPSHSPWVLQFPHSAWVPHQQNIVVDLFAAVFKDSGFVELPICGIDGHS